MGNILTRITDCQRRMKTLFEVFEGTTPRVLILGLDGAGKTTLLSNAKLEDYIYAISPPQGVTIEHVTPRRGATLQVYDVKGSKLTRHMWHSWFPKSEAIVFVVDSADRVRIDEAKFELHDLLSSRWLRKVPLVVAANKQDMSDCMSEEEVTNELDLKSITNRDWSIMGISAKKTKDVMNVLDDVVDKIVAFRHYKSSLSSVKDPGIKKHDKENKKNLKEPEKNGMSEFTSIEDVDAMKENIPSLFDSINSKNETYTKEAVEEDSGLSSRESVMYDQMNEETAQQIQEGKPDSLQDEESFSLFIKERNIKLGRY